MKIPRLLLSAWLAWAPLAAVETPVNDLIAVNKDGFSKRITWSANFTNELDGAEPIIPCLMRVQNLTGGDPFCWSPALLVYRLNKGDQLLLRLVAYPEGTKEHRREYDYLANNMGMHGQKIMRLDLTGSTDPMKGRVRMWVDNHPVTWSKLQIRDLQDPTQNLERDRSTALISGDAATLYTAVARWAARGDTDKTGYSYTLTSITEISGVDP